MKFYYQNENGEDIGPLDKSEVIELIEADRIMPTTPVRNVLMQKYQKAAELNSFSDSLKSQIARWENNETNIISERVREEIRFYQLLHDSKFAPTRQMVSLYLPVDGSGLRRWGALMIDGGIWVIIGLVLFSLFIYWGYLANAISYAADSLPFMLPENHGAVFLHDEYIVWAKNPNEIELILRKVMANYVNSAALLLLLGILLYYGLMLGYFAQTLGMRFFGLAIVRNDLNEVGYLQSFAFTILMLLLSWTAIFSLLIGRRTLSEYIAQCRICFLMLKLRRTSR